MVCPYCTSPTHVTNSRRRRLGYSIWRRRECLTCQQVFSTLEYPIVEKIIVLKTLEGRLKPLKQINVYTTVFQALGGLKAASETAQHLTETCLNKILQQGEPVVSEKHLQKIIFATLKAYQHTAAQRYLLEELNTTEEEFGES